MRGDNRERRSAGLPAELRAEAGGTGRTVAGYALLFGETSRELPGGFKETILPGSLDGVIARSDVFALLDHDMSRGVLARSTNGSGTLSLEVDARGLRYEFEAPATALGDELVEGLRRGDIRQSSFAFTVDEDEWVRTDDGGTLRVIKRFRELFDVSPCWRAAYESTEASVRSADGEPEKEKEPEDDEAPKDAPAEKEEGKTPETNPETTPEETPAEKDGKEEKDERSDDDKKECERSEDESEEEKEKPEESPEESPEEEKKDERSAEDPVKEEAPEERKENNTKSHNVMKDNKFSLLKAINSLVEGRSFDETTQSVHDAGVAEFRKSNLNVPGRSIAIPLGGKPEERGAILAGTATQGAEAVATDLLGIVPALKSRLILTAAGANLMTGCVGNIEIPFYSGSTCGWKQEGGKADRGEGQFFTKTLSAKRLTSVLHVSRQFLLQDSVGAEEAIKKDLVDSVAVTFEKTILGTGAGSQYEPAGILNGVSPDTAAFSYSDAVLMEAELEHADVYGNYVYLASPSAKAVLRSTPVDAGSGRFVMEGGEVLGVPVYSSNTVADKGLILCDPKEIFIAMWSGISLYVDESSLCDEDTIRIVVNLYCDAIARRDEAFVKRILA